MEVHAKLFPCLRSKEGLDRSPVSGRGPRSPVFPGLVVMCMGFVIIFLVPRGGVIHDLTLSSPLLGVVCVLCMRLDSVVECIFECVF